MGCRMLKPNTQRPTLARESKGGTALQAAIRRQSTASACSAGVTMKKSSDHQELRTADANVATLPLYLAPGPERSPNFGPSPERAQVPSRWRSQGGASEARGDAQWRVKVRPGPGARPCTRPRPRPRSMSARRAHCR